MLSEILDFVFKMTALMLFANGIRAVWRSLEKNDMLDIPCTDMESKKDDN